MHNRRIYPIPCTWPASSSCVDSPSFSSSSPGKKRKKEARTKKGIIGPASQDVAAKTKHMAAEREQLDLVTFTEFIRAKVEHEDALRNNRMMWFVLIEGLLFAGLGALLKEKAIIVAVLSAVGVLVSLSFAILFFYGEVAMENIKEYWLEYCEENGCDVTLPVIGLDHLALRKSGSLKKWLHSSMHLFLPWRFLPWVFGVTWALVWYLAT